MPYLRKMISVIQKPYLYAVTFSIVLLSFSCYSLLDAFILPSKLADVTTPSLESSSGSSSTNSSDGSNTGSSNSSGENDSQASGSSEDAVITDTSYQDENLTITISTIREENTNVYIADVKISSIDYLKTALAKQSYGTNITEKTSSIASSHQAILAINGDYYGANKSGYVLKNSVLYRSLKRGDSQYDDLAILSDGSFYTFNESEVSADDLLSKGVTQLFAFGPTLIEQGKIAVNSNSEVGQSMSSNPRTAIGIIEPLHYLFVVSDGRTSASSGLSLYQLASILDEYGCETAYNLDGGGSSTMYFNGKVINQPTTNGKSISERAVSDIVYIGY